MKVSANSLKQGHVIVFDKRLYIIIKAPEHVKPGKGPAYVQLEMKDVKSLVKLNQRISSSDQVEKAYLEQQQYRFLYEQNSELCFMNVNDFEQIQINKTLIDKNLLLFLQEGMEITIESFQDDPVNFIFPTNAILEIKETEAVIKGSTSAPSYKPALMDNGITVKVPAYLTRGEKIIVKIEDGSFVERIK